MTTQQLTKAQELIRLNKDKLDDLIRVELTRAINLHGLQDNITLEQQYLIVSEEILELVREIQEGNINVLKTEIIQSIAMLIKMYWICENV